MSRFLDQTRLNGLPAEGLARKQFSPVTQMDDAVRFCGRCLDRFEVGKISAANPRAERGHRLCGLVRPGQAGHSRPAAIKSGMTCEPTLPDAPVTKTCMLLLLDVTGCGSRADCCSRAAAAEAADIAHIAAFHGLDFGAVEQRLGCHLRI